MRNQYVNILGVRVHTVSIQIVLREIEHLIRNGGKGYITVTGVHGIMESQKSDSIKVAHNYSFLTVPDGMPLVYIGYLSGFSGMERCYGPDLMAAILKESVGKGYTHFLYGGREGVAETLKTFLEEKIPGVKIVGTFSPPFRTLNEQEREKLVETIEAVRPNIVWVGLSTPKQELFMYEYLPLLKTNLLIGVGAAFDFHTGKIKSAPRWMQKLALEWAYRLIQEPRRLWKRYLINNPLFIYCYCLQMTAIKNYAIE